MYLQFWSEDKVGQNNIVSKITISGLVGSDSTSGFIRTSECPTTVQADRTIFAQPYTYKPGGQEGLFRIPDGSILSDNAKHLIEWDQATGTAVLTMDPDNAEGMLAGEQVVFALPLRNPPKANPCQRPTLMASGRINITTPIPFEISRDKAILDGEQDGDACPLLVRVHFRLAVVASA